MIKLIHRPTWVIGQLTFVILMFGWIAALPADDGVKSIGLPEERSTINEDDKQALLVLYESLGGRAWNNNTNWLQGDVSSWFGITTVNGRVTRIELANNNLGRGQPGNGSIPAEIGNLTELEVLDLSSNRVRLRVPEEITSLANLERLLLNNNEIEELPDLGDMPSLEEVRVENNRLTFGDLEPNIEQKFSLTYAPQDTLDVFTASVNRSGKYVAFLGESVEINAEVDGAFNEYQWYRNGVAISGETSDSYRVNDVSRTNTQGVYHLEVTNGLLPELALRTIDLSFVFKFEPKWLDIGAYQNEYSDSGARSVDLIDETRGMEYPGILRYSGHDYREGFWIGVKDWTDPEGQYHPYFVIQEGQYVSGFNVIFPVEHRLVGRYENTVVEVNGEPASKNKVELDEINPNLAADRIVYNTFNTAVGVTTTRKMYAYANPFHENYHIIESRYCNTGNVDADDEIELPTQTLRDVFFFGFHRWRGNEQASWSYSTAQTWGSYNMIDVVGDGNEDYPVDFTAIYLWAGNDGYQSSRQGYSSLGSPLYATERDGAEFGRPNLVAPTDTVGRLSGPTMVGRSILHADNSPTDNTYDPLQQPHTLGWGDNDASAYSSSVPSQDGNSRITHEFAYEYGILTYENPALNPGCASCSSRMYPHYADRRDPSKDFWDPSYEAYWRPGGFSPIIAYGPYDMAPGECVDVTVSEGIAGLSFDAATKIGQQFNEGGRDDAGVIAYDANRDGSIETTPFDYDNVFVGTEAQTKNQWVMSGRDSLYQMFYRARDVYEASNKMTTYPIVEPPRAPQRFSLWSQPNSIALDWMPASGGPEIIHWELYRTENWVDNLYVNGCLDDAAIPCGYERIATLGSQTTSYTDTTAKAGVDYYYYLQGIGRSQTEDDGAITGTPGGVPLRSGRYLTQTYTPISIGENEQEVEETPEDVFTFALEGNYPNPVRRATKIEYTLPSASHVNLSLYDVLGREVRIMIDEEKSAGMHEHLLKASGLANGVYFYVLRAGENRAEGKMLIVR